LVPKKYIYGKALFRYWPLTAASVIHHEDVNPPGPPTRGFNPDYQDNSMDEPAPRPYVPGESTPQP
jgi:hypothetical protein